MRGGPTTEGLSAVLFDMDGLLLDTEAISRRLWIAAAAEQGHDILAIGFEQFVGRPAPDCDRILAEQLPALDVARLRAATGAGWERCLAERAIPVKPGVERLTDALRARGLPYAVATSTRRALALAKLEAAGLAARFPVLVGGDEVARGKPAPDIFLAAAQRLGVEPGRCLVLEDSPAGMRAAHAAGCRAIMIPDLVPCPEPAWTVAASLDAVLALLADELEALPVG